MYKQIVNKNGEELYILTLVCTNDIRPYIRVDTWENVKHLQSE